MGSKVERLMWYRRRLASMSGPEVLHRVIEQIKRAQSRGRVPDLAGPAGDGTRLPALPGLKEGLRAMAEDRALLDCWRVFADRAREGRYHFLGLDWPAVTDPKRWHVDPVSGRHWPDDIYCFRVPFRSAHDMGDVKYVWELNRLQHLQPVAALAALTGEAELIKLCVQEIESWIDANPPYQGVNWASGIELTLRVVSLIVVVSLLGDEAFSQAQRRKLWSTLAHHGYWLMRFPSRFSSANNHLVAEAAGLYLLGGLASSLPQADRWLDYGRRTLMEEIHRQIHEDGVGAEQSPTYTAFSLEFWLLCGEVGRRKGHPFPEPFWQRLSGAGETLRWMLDGAANAPRIGDDDEGRVLVSELHETDYVASVISCIARAVDQPRLIPPRTRSHLRHALFPAPAKPAAEIAGLRHMSTGGYTVIRQTEKGRPCLWVIDHGPLGYLSIAAHGHADALSVLLHLDDQPVLVDAGTYLYHSGGAWRDHFRGTAAHNTLSIAGSDSSRIAGAFNWSRKASVSLVEMVEDPACWAVEAEHDGFVEEFGLRHRRRIERLGDGLIAITDRLIGSSGGQDVEIGFLLHPDLGADTPENIVVIRRSDRELVQLSHEGGLTPEVQRGLDDPPRGWYSEAFGRKVPADRIVFTGRMSPGDTSRVILEILPEGQAGSGA